MLIRTTRPPRRRYMKMCISAIKDVIVFINVAYRVSPGLWRHRQHFTLHPASFPLYVMIHCNFQHMFNAGPIYQHASTTHHRCSVFLTNIDFVPLSDYRIQVVSTLSRFGANTSSTRTTPNAELTGLARERSLRVSMLTPATGMYVHPVPDKVDGVIPSNPIPPTPETCPVMAAAAKFIRFSTPMTAAEKQSERTIDHRALDLVGYKLG